MPSKHKNRKKNRRANHTNSEGSSPSVCTSISTYGRNSHFEAADASLHAEGSGEAMESKKVVEDVEVVHENSNITVDDGFVEEDEVSNWNIVGRAVNKYYGGSSQESSALDIPPLSPINPSRSSSAFSEENDSSASYQAQGVDSDREELYEDDMQGGFPMNNQACVWDCIENDDSFLVRPAYEALLKSLVDENGNPNVANEEEHVGDVEVTMDVNEEKNEEKEDDGIVLIALDSLKHSIYPAPTCDGEGQSTIVVRLTHAGIRVTELRLHPESVELYLETSKERDSLLCRHLADPSESIPEGTLFVWHRRFEEIVPVDTEFLEVRANGKELVMRRAAATDSLSSSSSSGLPGRLSSSTSAIRTRDYSRSYGKAPESTRAERAAERASMMASSYRYTPSTSISSLSSSTSSGYSSSLARSPSVTPVAYHRSLFTPTTSSSSSSSSSTSNPMTTSMTTERGGTTGSIRTERGCNAGPMRESRISAYSPLKYSTSTYSTSTLGREPAGGHSSSILSHPSPDTQQQSATGTLSSRTTIRSRSSSVLGSYRSPNVRELNAQAAAREKSEKEREEYKNWEEREREREQTAEPLVKDFRRKLGTPSGQTTMKVTPSGGLGLGTASPATSSSRYSSSLSALSSSAAFSSSSSPSPQPPSYETTNGYSTKPTAKVTPYEERGQVVKPGFTGLRNIGNTCFMNATLQMLVNNVELKTYFLENYHRSDVNIHNPLGFKGRLADAFADFMHQMWSCTSRAIEPARIKELVAEKASQFANFAQHDAHEFLSFLLDGLHEDLNRVKTKSTTSTVEADGRPDIEVANESWRNHLLRNDSIFVDLFHGQLKSRLQCPRCDRVSITFDPFVYLPVPFPKQKKSISLHFWPLDPVLKPVKMSVHFSAEGSIGDVLQAVGDVVGAPAKTLRLVEIVSRRVHKQYNASEPASYLSPGDTIYVFQVHSPSDCNEEVIELLAVQRLLFSSTLRYVCADCGIHRKDLSVCDGCYNAYYCDEKCQRNHWEAGGHQDECKRRHFVDTVGQPFIVSLPKSKCTYNQMMRVIEARCKHSVDIFQPPITINGTASSLLDDDSTPTTKSKRRSSKSPSPSSATSPTVNGGLSNGVSPPNFLPPTMTDKDKMENTPKKQTVLPEQRSRVISSKARPEARMIRLRRIADQGAFHGEDIKDDGTDVPLSIPSGAFVAVNWINVKDGKPFINLDSRKQLDVDEEKGNKYAMATASQAQAGGDPTLQEMLSMFSETERLKPEESWYCNKCKEHVEATKRLELYRLPPVLIIQLKRFVYTAAMNTMHRRSKDERRVVYPLQELNLAPFLADGAPSELPPVYDLTGVVCHSGSSYFGHYISMGRLPNFDAAKTDIDWRNFDDSIVTKISPSCAQSDDAYLLFYKQRGYSTRSIFTRHYSFDPKNAHSSVDVLPFENGNC